MARTADEIIKSIIGEQVVQIAILTSRVEALEEQLKTVSDSRTQTKDKENK